MSSDVGTTKRIILVAALLLLAVIAVRFLSGGEAATRNWVEAKKRSVVGANLVHNSPATPRADPVAVSVPAIQASAFAPEETESLPIATRAFASETSPIVGGAGINRIGQIEADVDLASETTSNLPVSNDSVIFSLPTLEHVPSTTFDPALSSIPNRFATPHESPIELTQNEVSIFQPPNTPDTARVLPPFPHLAGNRARKTDLQKVRCHEKGSRENGIQRQGSTRQSIRCPFVVNALETCLDTARRRSLHRRHACDRRQFASD